MVQHTTHILIVDDDQHSVQRVASMLKRSTHCSLEFAYNGKEALDLMKTRTKVHHQLVIMEILIPALNGVEVCEYMGSDPVLRGIPVILMSELPLRSAEFQRSLRRYNEFSVVAGIIEKPINEAELQRQVKLIFESKGEQG